MLVVAVTVVGLLFLPMTLLTRQNSGPTPLLITSASEHQLWEATILQCSFTMVPWNYQPVFLRYGFVLYLHVSTPFSITPHIVSFCYNLIFNVMSLRAFVFGPHVLCLYHLYAASPVSSPSVTPTTITTAPAPSSLVATAAVIVLFIVVVVIAGE